MEKDPPGHTIPTKVAIASLLQNAFARHEQGHIAEAAGLYRQILQLIPDHFDALHLSGIAATQSGKPRQAIEFINKAIQANPNNAAAYSNLGLALQQVGRNEEALVNYELALMIEPDNPAVIFNHANVLRDLGRYHQALTSYDRLLQFLPKDAEALYYSGNVLLELKRPADALERYDRVLQLTPACLAVLINRGIALHQLNRLKDALASYEYALGLTPDNAEALYNRANVLGALNRPQEALVSYDMVLRLRPDHPQVLNNRGNALRALLRLDAAIASFERTQLAAPGYTDARWNESLCRLLAGDFERGLSAFEARWDSELANDQRHFTQPLWLGKQALQNKTILLHAEQGFGDTLQFCRYVHKVFALGANIILEVQPALKRLLGCLSDMATVIARGDALPDYDFHCPLLSLPLAFNTNIHSIPQATQYIQSNAQMVDAWRLKLGPKKLLRVGVVWSGGKAHKNNHNRSISLIEFKSLFNTSAEFHCLQQEISTNDQQFLSKQSHVKLIQHELHDFAESAALIELMDVVITVDTSVAHLAGAMGKTTWVLLPFSPDWRWLLNRSDSPWYPSVRLFRQAGIGDWGSVINNVGQALTSHLS